MNIKRRTFLKGTLASSAVAIAAGAGLLSPTQVLAAWPKGAFEAKSVADSLSSLVGGSSLKESESITVKAPDIAENGAVVPVEISTSLRGVDSISILVEENGTPLVANFHIGKRTSNRVATRIKMGKTSNIIAVVRSKGTNYSAKKVVKVTIGGCGG